MSVFTPAEITYLQSQRLARVATSGPGGLAHVEPERGLGLGEGADVAGAVLVTSSLMLGIYAIVGVTDHGWASIQTGGFGSVAIALLAGFIARQATAQHPLLALRVFRSRNLSGANAVQALMIAGMLGMLFIGALYMQRILGYQPLEIGLAFLPAALGIATLSLRFAPRLNVRFGERATLQTGLTIMAAGLAWLIRVPVDGTYVVDLLPSMILIGVGAGLAFPSLNRLAMATWLRAIPALPPGW